MIAEILKPVFVLLHDTSFGPHAIFFTCLVPQFIYGDNLRTKLNFLCKHGRNMTSQDRQINTLHLSVQVSEKVTLFVCVLLRMFRFDPCTLL